MALSRAGANWLLVPGDLASLESAAARFGCLVIAVDEPMHWPGLRRPERRLPRRLPDLELDHPLGEECG